MINKVFKSVILLSIAILFMVIALNMLNKKEEATSDGQVEISIYLTDDMLYKSKKIDFNIGDTLVNLLKNNFDEVIITDSSYGPFLSAIEGYITPDDYSSYLNFYVNGKYSEVGMGQIELIDQMLIEIKVEGS